MTHSLSLAALLIPVFVLLATVRGSTQACDCTIGFPLAAGAVTIDGVIDEAGEYAGAFTIDTSTNPACLKHLYDYVGPAAMNLIGKVVKVFAKRDAANNLYLAFKILDSTQTLGAPNPGERLIVQIDPDDSHGAQLSNGAAPNQKDYRFEVAHKWSTNGGTNALNFDERSFFDSTLSPGACMKQRWNLQTFPASVQIAGHNDGSGVAGGYSIEMQIPAAAVGLASFTSTTTIGVAFVIVNDLGRCPGGACEATATSFPATIPVNNVVSPFAADDLAECSGLLIPDAWSTGFFGPPPPFIEIKRDPVWWSAASVEALECENRLSTYTYYAGVPCRIRVRARIENTGTGGAGRNVLFLWGSPGVGQTDWRFIDLQKNVTIQPGGTFVTSATWNRVPAGLGGHPCVRVYVLPASFLPGFPESRMTSNVNTLDPTYITDLEATYRTGAQCMAQKNLNQPVPGNCPIEGCSVTTSIWQPFTVYAQEPPPQPPPFEFLIPQAEAERLTQGRTIAQIEAFGKAQRPGGARSGYDIIEPIGGGIHLLDAEALAQPLNLVVGNPEPFAQAVFVSVVARGPDGMPVTLNTTFEQGATLRAREERRVTFSSRPIRRCFGCFGSASGASALMLFAGVLLVGRRAWRR